MLSQLRELLVTQLKTDLPVREYGLIQAAREHIPSFPKQPLADPHVLFQSHFLIRHAVYCLRNEWRACQHAELTISPLYFEKTLWQAGLVDIVRYDGVAAFYLDFANLERITAQEVSWLLSGFWDKYAAYHARQQLCQLLDLPSDCTEQLLKQTWRKAAMRLHPDKGGDIERFKQVQSAYESWRRPQRLI